MPKGKRKGKFEHRRTEQPDSSDEDAGIDMSLDNCSEVSQQSDLRSNNEDPESIEEPAMRRRTRTRKKLKAEQEEMDLEKCIESHYLTPLPETKKYPWVATAQTGWNLWNEMKYSKTFYRRGLFSSALTTTTEESIEEPAMRRRTRTRKKLKAEPEEIDIEKCLESYYITPLPESKKYPWVATAQTRWRLWNEMEHSKTFYRRGLFSSALTTTEENDIQEKLEEKVLELVEGLNARGAAARASALVSLRSVLQRRALGSVLSPHRATLADHISRALRRGRDGERKPAAALAPLLALQIGEEGTEEFVNEVRPALVAAATDKTASVETRTECCSSLAVLCYLLEEDVTELLEVMRMYETIFSGSYLKGDGSVKVSGSAVEEGAVHAAALDGWALLFSLLAPSHAASVLNEHPPSFARLAEMLDACSLEVRLAAGGALAISHERTCAVDPPDLEPALERLERLVRDSHKYRARRDRKIQRATFRDILKYFQEEEPPAGTARVGAETVWCGTWRARAAYGALAGALAGGLQVLAATCAPLRAALALPEPALLAHPQPRPNKLQRHLQNNAACKARTLARGKNRDKRSAALAI